MSTAVQPQYKLLLTGNCTQTEGMLAQTIQKWIDAGYTPVTFVPADHKGGVLIMKFNPSLPVTPIANT